LVGNGEGVLQLQHVQTVDFGHIVHL
jgi:hypothetical protein